jgi:hypothetical protein
LNICGYSVTVARDASSIKEWFNSTSPLKIYPYFPPKQAMKFRKEHLRGWLVPGACNYYIGVGTGNNLFGVLGFLNATYANYDILLKADTTPPQWQYSTELLLYVLKSKEVQQLLSDKFNRHISTAYSKCFSANPVISRYRKFADLISKEEVRENKTGAPNELKKKARQYVNDGIRKGTIIKQPCEVCGRTDYVEAHHPDYNHPDIFRWHCIEHHNEADGKDETCYKIVGYNLGYLFQLGAWSLKEGKARFIQKHGNRI